VLAAYIETASTLTSFVWYSKTLLNSTLGKCKTACMSTSSCTHGNFFTNGSRCELGFEAGASKQVKCHGQCASFIKWYAPKGVKAGSMGSMTLSSPHNQPKPKCPPGWVPNPGGHPACFACNPGKFYKAKSLDGIFGANCKVCAPGKFTSKIASTSCVKCPAGRVTVHKRRETCERCVAGRYTGVSGSAWCNLCSSGQFSKPGSARCATCPSGRWGYGENGNSSCSGPCLAGFSGSNAGAYDQRGSKNQRCAGPCPTGMHSKAGDARCTPCGNGTFGTTAAAPACAACPSGKYSASSTVGKTACSECQIAKVSSPGSAKCVEMTLPPTWSPTPVPTPPTPPPTPAPHICKQVDLILNQTDSSSADSVRGCMGTYILQQHTRIGETLLFTKLNDGKSQCGTGHFSFLYRSAGGWEIGSKPNGQPPVFLQTTTTAFAPDLIHSAWHVRTSNGQLTNIGIDTVCASDPTGSQAYIRAGDRFSTAAAGSKLVVCDPKEVPPACRSHFSFKMDFSAWAVVMNSQLNALRGSLATTIGVSPVDVQATIQRTDPSQFIGHTTTRVNVKVAYHRALCSEHKEYGVATGDHFRLQRKTVRCVPRSSIKQQIRGGFEGEVALEALAAGLQTHKISVTARTLQISDLEFEWPKASQQEQDGDGALQDVTRAASMETQDSMPVAVPAGAAQPATSRASARAVTVQPFPHPQRALPVRKSRLLTIGALVGLLLTSLGGLFQFVKAERARASAESGRGTDMSERVPLSKVQARATSQANLVTNAQYQYDDPGGGFVFDGGEADPAELYKRLAAAGRGV
jgi:hypothetical protein